MLDMFYTHGVPVFIREINRLLRIGQTVFMNSAETVNPTCK